MKKQQSECVGVTGRERELLLLLAGVKRKGEQLSKAEFARMAGYKGAPAVVFREYSRLREELERYVNGWRGKASLQPPNAILALERRVQSQDEEIARLRAALQRAREYARHVDEELGDANAARQQATTEGAKLRAMVTALVRKLVLPNPTRGAIAMEKALEEAVRSVSPGLELVDAEARVLSLARGKA